MLLCVLWRKMNRGRKKQRGHNGVEVSGREVGRRSNREASIASFLGPEFTMPRKEQKKDGQQ